MKCPKCGNLTKSVIAGISFCDTYSWLFDENAIREIVDTEKYVCKCENY